MGKHLQKMPSIMIEIATILRRFVIPISCFLILTQSAGAERLPIKTYTATDGLAHNNVNRIVRDSRGFMWFCTEEGLSRFDGYSFTSYGIEQGLPNRTVTDFLETGDGQFWLSTHGGLVRFDPQGTPLGRVVYTNELQPGLKPMFTVLVPQDEDQFARALTVLCESRDGTIWCGSMKCLYRLNRNGEHLELQRVETPVGSNNRINVSDILEDHRGSLWIASFGALCRRYPDGRIIRFTVRDGLPDDNVQDLLEDGRGRLWAATRLGGMFRFSVNDDSGRLQVETYTQREGLPSDWVFQIYETSNKRLWAATNVGLVEFLPQSGSKGREFQFRTYTRRNGLSFQEVSALNEDSSGNLWLGTPAAGVMKITRNGFVTYGEQDGLMNIGAIFQDPAGKICFRGAVLGDQRQRAFDGSGMDVLRVADDKFYQRFGCFDGQRFDWFEPRQPFQFGWVPNQDPAQTGDGEWWVGSGQGLYRFPNSQSFDSLNRARPRAVYTKDQGLPNNQIYRVFADSRDNVWVSAFGLMRWDHKRQKLDDFNQIPGGPNLSNNGAFAFSEDRSGNVWMSFSTGIARYRDGNFKFFGPNDGLSLGTITQMFCDHRGRLWLASSRIGLIRVDDPTAEHPSFLAYTTGEGLSGNNVAAVTEDSFGKIYVATGRGLDQLDPETGRIRHYTTADGLAPGDIIATFCDRNGTVWVGTHRGLSKFLPEPSESSSAPLILITDLKIAGDHQSISALGESDISIADLAHDRNQLQIDFVALGFAAGEKLRYQYQLDARSTVDWSELSELRTVTFANLAPGKYRFQARAVNADGVVSSTPAMLSFTILPPIWQRWWFVTIAVVLLGIAAYRLYLYRVTRLLELERVRTRIASDLHDDIGANLTRIAILSEVAYSQLHEDKSAIETPLSSIAQISRESVASMGDIVWAINPKRDHLIDLVQRMRRLASEVFAGRKIDFEFTTSDQEDLKIGADVRRDLFLVFKEIINNAARHSSCSNASIDLQIENGCFVLRVKDDGLGFEVSGATEGNGLVSINRRITNLGGQLVIDSHPGKGTEIFIKVPIR